MYKIYCVELYASCVRVRLYNECKRRIELPELMTDGPAMVRDVALKQGQCLQHMAYCVETFDDVLAQLQKQGYVVGQTGSPLGEHSRFAYVFQPSRPDSIDRKSVV